jgi:integrase
VKLKAVALAYLDFSAARCAPKELGARVRAMRQIVRARGNLEIEEALTAGALAGLMADWRDSGRSRGYINGLASRLRAFARWAVASGSAAGTIVPALECARPYRPGSHRVVDRAPVEPIDRGSVEAVLPHLPPRIAALAELAWWSGARMGELVQLRPADLSPLERGIRIFRPARHKTMGSGARRAILLGARALAILGPALEAWGAGEDEYLFSPARAEEARRGGRAPGGPRAPGAAYTTSSVARAIRRACRAAGIPPWGPHRLRHAFATRMALAHGPLIASRLLGHRSIRITEGYIGDLDLAGLVGEGL